jgi:hypothetical protein
MASSGKKINNQNRDFEIRAIIDCNYREKQLEISVKMRNIKQTNSMTPAAIFITCTLHILSVCISVSQVFK